MPRLILIGGASGSGKTTLGKHMWRATDGAFHFETDAFFMDEFGEYCFDAAKLSEAHAWCQTQVKNRMRNFPHADIIVSNTFTRKWERQPYIDLAETYGYELVWILMRTSASAEELAARNTHGVPVEIIRKQLERIEP